MPKILFEGTEFEFREGDSLGAVLMAHGIRCLGRAPDGAPRGAFCNMGICFDCLVGVTQAPGAAMVELRACLTPARDGMTARRLSHGGENGR